MKQGTLRKILTVVSFMLAAILFTGTIIARENANVISSALNAKTFEVEDLANGDTDTEYYKSDFQSIADMHKVGRATAVEVVEEGAVLLKNENNALPLGKGDKISLVGVTGYDPVYGGRGSGSISANGAADVVGSLENAGLVLNPTLKEKYTSEEWAAYKRSSEGRFGNTVQTINEAPWTVVDEACGSSFAEYGDAAIMLIGRVGGEGYDLIHREGDAGDGINNGDGLGPDYLGLNANEITVLNGLKQLKADGKIKKIVVIINYAGMFEGDMLKNDPAIDSIMWVGALGMGGNAIGRLLVGDVTPSGRLSDTMWMDNAFDPVNVNYDSRIYSNADDFEVPTALGTGIYPEATLASYVVYQEGMYLGYRYTETRYEDVVLGTPNVGDYDYDKVVAYPFGFGLSYAQFKLSDASVTKTGDREYVAKVTVTNTSDKYAGKCSVPVYVSKPYGDYAKQNNIQVPSVELINFTKTQLLQPGQSETVTIPLDERYFTSYDAYGAEGYILMDGDYYVIVGGSAHDAVNNLLAAKAKNGVKIDESKMTAAGDASLVARFPLTFNKDKYAYSDVVSAMDGISHVRITNLFDYVDMNRYEGRGENHIEYYSRENWNAISMDMTDGYWKLYMTEQMARDIYAQLPDQTGNYNNSKGIPEKYRQPIPKDDGEYPTYGKAAGLNLIDMRYDENGNEIDMFDPVWETFMDQLTWEDTVLLCSSGQHTTEACETVAKPKTRDENGPNGIGGRGNYYGFARGLAYRTAEAAGQINEEGKPIEELVDPEGLKGTTSFPSNGVLAASFNKDLAERVGKVIGEDAIWLGFSGLYGLGLDIHRSPYLGRTSEYYSECGMLTGLIGAAQTKGLESKGCHVYNKHCVMNDQEDCRHGIGAWNTEQALREIYLRAFELPILEGSGFNTMASFNRLGVVACAASKELGQDFLRGECGMKGIIVTDFYGDMDGSQNCDPYFEQTYGTYMGGSDIPDGSQPMAGEFFAKYEKGYSKMAWAMRTAAKRIMYQTVWSCAMNGISSDTKIVQITPWWETALYTADAVVGVLFLACLAWTATALLKKKRA